MRKLVVVVAVEHAKVPLLSTLDIRVMKSDTGTKERGHPVASKLAFLEVGVHGVVGRLARLVGTHGT